DTMRGKKVRCPGCGNIITVTAGPPAPAALVPTPVRPPTAAKAPAVPATSGAITAEPTSAEPEKAPAVTQTQRPLRAIVLSFGLIGAAAAGFLGYQLVSRIAQEVKEAEPMLAFAQMMARAGAAESGKLDEFQRELAKIHRAMDKMPVLPI